MEGHEEIEKKQEMTCQKPQTMTDGGNTFFEFSVVWGNKIQPRMKDDYGQKHQPYGCRLTPYKHVM